jgi:hypothetical protein
MVGSYSNPSIQYLFIISKYKYGVRLRILRYECTYIKKTNEVLPYFFNNIYYLDYIYIHYWKNYLLYWFKTLICTGYWTSTKHLIQMWSSICTGRNTRYKCHTFVPGRASTQYKCALHPATWQGAFLLGEGTIRYKCFFFVLCFSLL